MIFNEYILNKNNILFDVLCKESLLIFSVIVFSLVISIIQTIGNPDIPEKKSFSILESFFHASIFKLNKFIF